MTKTLVCSSLPHGYHSRRRVPPLQDESDDGSLAAFAEKELFVEAARKEEGGREEGTKRLLVAPARSFVAASSNRKCTVPLSATLLRA